MATIVGTNGNNPNLNGASAKDHIFGLGGHDTLRGFDSHDQLFGGSGNDQLLGGSGNDRLKGGVGNDLLDGGTGNDTADYSNATIDPPGPIGPIFTTGANSGVRVNLNIAGDQNTGGAGRDTLVSIENLIGTNFNDILTGDGGNNVLTGLDGHDQLNGGNGNDILNGGSGNDSLSGGTGNDTASYETALAGVTVTLGLTQAQNTGGGGIDTLLDDIENLTGSDSHDPIYGHGGNDILTGDSGNNRLSGLSGIDLLFGEDGNDQLIGGSGADILNGGNGNDTLVGGLGQDTLNGGRGVDIFDYNETEESPFSGDEDLIIGFTGAGAAIGDQIDLSTIDADITQPGNQAFTDEQISYFKDEEQNTGVLWVEIIGRGSGPELVIALDGNPTLFIQAGHPGSDILL